MSEVKGITRIKYVKQGDTVTCGLRSTFPLKQFISNGNGAVSPSFATNKPCIYPVVRSSLSASRISPETVGYKWYYNTVEIQFDNSGNSLALGSLAAGTFHSEWKSVDGFGCPTLTICKELASANNIDSDSIEFSGVVNTGFATVVSASIEVAIEQTEGDAYVAYIAINNGGVIDDDVETLTAKAHLLVGGVEVTSGVKYAWYKMAVTGGTDGWVSTGNTSQSITIGASAINNKELYRCVITSGGKSAESVIEVADETDVLIIYPNPTDGAGNTVPEEVGSAQQRITYVPKVYKRGTSEEVSGYTFNYLLTNSSGDEIASQDGGTSFAVTLAHAIQADGDLTLIISAE